ncbi:unnamed protein product [Effrenium voratum]|uniref:Uncharacterized protein n=1 Tax=Effrenium voratum TaxID=2562239 RepID=A0AA36IWJ2_9DINO|nr:unnamed protein product [Effrenium voratum]
MPTSQTAETYIRMIGEGKASVAAVAQLARANLADFEAGAPASVAAFASLGNFGNCPQNEERDLHRWLSQLFSLKLSTYCVEAEVQVPNKTGLRKTAIPFLLPHEILHCLAESSSWQEIHRLFVTHLQCWQHIASLCERRKWRLFKIVPKHHYFQEMAQDLKRNLVNPNRAHACWYDESFLGYIKKIATACHSSSMIQSRFWQRYLLLLAMRFEDARRCSR